MSCVVRSPEKEGTTAIGDGSLETKRCKILKPFDTNIKSKSWVSKKDGALRKQAIPKRGLATGFYDLPLTTGKTRFGQALKANRRKHESDDDDDESEDDVNEDSGDESDYDGVHLAEGNSRHKADDSDSETEESLFEFRRKKFAHLSVHNQHFKSHSKAEPIENFIYRQVKKKKKCRLIKKELEDLSNAKVGMTISPNPLKPEDIASSQSTKKNSKVHFSLEDVMAIVENAVRSREVDLREEYGAILAMKLREQYEQYQKYTQDYMHKKLETSSFNYWS